MCQFEDRRCYAPATDRNREPILAVLKSILPPEGTVLEIASGTGQHAAFFAPHLTPRHWLPSDPNPAARDSISSWQADAAIANLYDPLNIDVTQPDWSDDIVQRQNRAVQAILPITAIVNINMIHISPWAACEGLFAGANKLLSPGQPLYLYGPFKLNDRHTAPSNEAFDQSLRSQNPDWGVRNLDTVAELAQKNQFRLSETVTMPANNLSVIFIRSS